MKTLLVSFKIFLFLTILTGIVYPIFVTEIVQVLFPLKANGSLIQINNTTIGSELIGQQFDSVIFFNSRPSVISYNPLPSGGSNFGLSNLKLKSMVDERKKMFIVNNHLGSQSVVPSEMLFASASGLDPHISTEAALLQVERITSARNFNKIQKQKLEKCIQDLTETPQFFCLGEDRINVLLLNLSLQKIK